MLGGRRGLAIIIAVLILISIVVSADILVSSLCSGGSLSGSLDEYHRLGLVIHRIYRDRRNPPREYLQMLNSSLSKYNGISILDIGEYNAGGVNVFYIVFREEDMLIVFTHHLS